jgi:hypothetical protein
MRRPGSKRKNVSAVISHRDRDGIVDASPSTSVAVSPKLMAALDVATGHVVAEAIERNDAVTFIAFLEQLDASIDSTLHVEIIIDRPPPPLSVTRPNPS